LHPLEAKSCDLWLSKLLFAWKRKNIEIENAFSVWQSVCNLKFERVFDGSQVMNITFFTDDEKQNAEINCSYKLNNKKSGT